jgi:type I restriction enzyme, R subunit
MPSDTSEKGLELIIISSLLNEAGYVQGNAINFDREHALIV